MFDLETIKAMNAPGFKAQSVPVLIYKPVATEEKLQKPVEAANVYSRHPRRSA